jgi:hypothetical protein
MLLGIFSTNSEKDFERRKAIRETYLSYYKRGPLLNGNDKNTSSVGRICALSALQAGELEKPGECQLVYTFVVGAKDSVDETAPTELLDDKTYPLTVDRPSHHPSSETDVVYLNIRENMEDGKTTTWFKYASSKIADDVQIDLISKVDTDTLIYPDKLLAEVEQKLGNSNNLPRPVRVYGGRWQFKTTRPRYCQGGFYFMSRDVARYITSDKCNRQKYIDEGVAIYHHRAEDAEVGRFVDSYPERVQWMQFNHNKAFYHEIEMKEPAQLRDLWQWILAEDEAQEMLEELKALSKGCPSEEKFLWALGQLKSSKARKEFMKLSTKAC